MKFRLKMFFVNIPLYENYTRVVYYPTSDHANGGKFVLYTKEMRPLKPTGSFISVPYHYGYEYAVFAAFDTGASEAVATAAASKAFLAAVLENPSLAFDSSCAEATKAFISSINIF